MRSVFIPFAAAALGACAAAPAARPLVSIPYKPDGKLIMVEARVNEAAPALLVVDSGASHSVLDPRFVERLGLKVTSQSSTTGTGKGAIPVGHVGPVSLRLGGFRTRLEDPWIIDLSKVPISKQAVGLLGSELFKSHVVRIDPVRRRFELFDPRGFRHANGGATVPLKVEGDKLFLEATLTVKPGLTTRRQLRIDTGSEGSVNDAIVAQSATIRRTVLGQGLGENYEAVSGIFETVELGPYRFERVWGPGGTPPSIGMELLRRFVLTFDAPNGRLHLAPTAAFDEPVPAPE